MTMPTANVSVTEPISSAIDRVKLLLFRPFDLGKWFVIGFCAWLAHLGEAGGFGGNYGNSSNFNSGDVRHQFDQAKEYFFNNLHWILPLVVAGIIFCLVLWLLFTWLSSRGKFMFLHCVALNRSEVSAPWHRFEREANSLFWFRVVFGLIGWVIMLPFLAVSGVVFFKLFLHGRPEIAAILMLAGMVLVFIGVAIIFGFIAMFMNDFVVPIMFLRGKTCWEAWRELWGLLSANAGNFALYVLLKIVLAMAIGVIILIIVLVTCCTAGCLMAIPYLGTVLLLPVLVFKRSYSLYFLAQFGRDYDVFPPVVPLTQAP